MSEEKLKTLKELKWESSDTSQFTEFDLKTEAVKWRKRYANIQDLEDVVDWIDNFFNLTEEDLK